MKYAYLNYVIDEAILRTLIYTICFMELSKKFKLNCMFDKRILNELTRLHFSSYEKFIDVA